MVLSLAAFTLYAAFALALLLTARRWVRPLSRRAALLLLLPLCFTGGAFLSGRIYAPVGISLVTLGALLVWGIARRWRGARR